MNTSFRKTQSQRAAAETGVAAAHKQTNISDTRKDVAAAEFAVERDERRNIRDQAMLIGGNESLASGGGGGGGVQTVNVALSGPHPNMHNNTRKKTTREFYRQKLNQI